MRILLSLFLVLFGGVFPLQASENVLKKASFIPQWSPQAQFAGYYVAKEMGIYKKYGIDLTILQGGPDRSAVEFLEKRKTDFASVWLSTAIQRRSRGVKLINLAQIIQRSALMLVAKKSSSIHHPKDMVAKKVSLWKDDFQIQPKAFFKKYNLHVKVIPQSFSINLFLRGGVDVASAMWYNEYHTLLNSGFNPDELAIFFFHEHGLNFPEDGIYTLEDFYKRDPALSCAFVKASLEGWLYAFSHPEETLNIVINHMLRAKIPANKIHQKWMLNRMKDLILPQNRNDPPIGALTSSDYLLVSKELQKGGFIKGIPDLNTFFIPCTSNGQK